MLQKRSSGILVTSLHLTKDVGLPSGGVVIRRERAGRDGSLALSPEQVLAGLGPLGGSDWEVSLKHLGRAPP